MKDHQIKGIIYPITNDQAEKILCPVRGDGTHYCIHAGCMWWVGDSVVAQGDCAVSAAAQFLKQSCDYEDFLEQEKG